MTGKIKENTADMLLKMYDLFLKRDALLIEINPYAEDADGSCKNCFIPLFLFDIFMFNIFKIY